MGLISRHSDERIMNGLRFLFVVVCFSFWESPIRFVEAGASSDFGQCSLSRLQQSDFSFNGKINDVEFLILLESLVPSSCDIVGAYRYSTILPRVWKVVTCVCENDDPRDLVKAMIKRDRSVDIHSAMTSLECCEDQLEVPTQNSAKYDHICDVIDTVVYEECVRINPELRIPTEAPTSLPTLSLAPTVATTEPITEEAEQPTTIEFITPTDLIIDNSTLLEEEQEDTEEELEKDFAESELGKAQDELTVTPPPVALASISDKGQRSPILGVVFGAATGCILAVITAIYCYIAKNRQVADDEPYKDEHTVQDQSSKNSADDQSDPIEEEEEQEIIPLSTSHHKSTTKPIECFYDEYNDAGKASKKKNKTNDESMHKSSHSDSVTGMVVRSSLSGSVSDSFYETDDDSLSSFDSFADIDGSQADSQDGSNDFKLNMSNITGDTSVRRRKPRATRRPSGSSQGSGSASDESGKERRGTVVRKPPVRTKSNEMPVGRIVRRTKSGDYAMAAMRAVAKRQEHDDSGHKSSQPGRKSFDWDEVSASQHKATKEELKKTAQARAGKGEGGFDWEEYSEHSRVTGKKGANKDAKGQFNWNKFSEHSKISIEDIKDEMTSSGHSFDWDEYSQHSKKRAKKVKNHSSGEGFDWDEWSQHSGVAHERIKQRIQSYRVNDEDDPLKMPAKVKLSPDDAIDRRENEVDDLYEEIYGKQSGSLDGSGSGGSDKKSKSKSSDEDESEYESSYKAIKLSAPQSFRASLSLPTSEQSATVTDSSYLEYVKEMNKGKKKKNKKKTVKRNKTDNDDPNDRMSTKPAFIKFGTESGPIKDVVDLEIDEGFLDEEDLSNKPLGAGADKYHSRLSVQSISESSTAEKRPSGRFFPTSYFGIARQSTPLFSSSGDSDSEEEEVQDIEAQVEQNVGVVQAFDWNQYASTTEIFQPSTQEEKDRLALSCSVHSIESSASSHHHRRPNNRRPRRGKRPQRRPTNDDDEKTKPKSDTTDIV